MDETALPKAPFADHEAPPLPGGVAALTVDLRGRRITRVTPELAALLGWAADDLVGRSLDDLCCPSERTAVARRFEDAVLFGRDTFAALAVPTARGGLIWVDVDARFLFQGGGRLEVVIAPVPGAPTADADRSLAVPARTVGGTPVPAEHPVAPGTPAGGTAVLGDQPGVRRAPSEPVARSSPPERAVEAPDEAAATLVMTALEAGGTAALCVGADGIVSSATPVAGRLLGKPVAGLRNRALPDVIGLPAAADEALGVAREGRMRQTVLAEVPGSGEPVVVEWVPGRARGAGFALLVAPGSVPESGDTDRLRFQAQLVAHVAHDLRDSMAAIFCGLQLLTETLPPGDERRRVVDQALDDSRRANRIVDEVLAVSRPGRQKREDLDIGGLVAATLARFRQRAGAGSVELREAITPDLRVSADRSSLERAFGNVIENALQATPHLGVLTVTVTAETRGVPGARVSIADTGTGIKPAIQPNIFEPFVTDRDGGTGLGLAITRRAVLDHGGQIDFETEEGRGTTFHVWLPRLV